MTTAPIPASVVKTVLVPCAPDRAFQLFSEGMARWWLASHSLTASGFDQVVMEPVPGGAWYEIGKAGERRDWGRVLIWDPPHRLVLDWQLSAAFTFDPDLHTELDVRFAPQGPGTLVRLEHRRLENYGAAAAKMAEVFAGPDAWAGLLAAYGAAL